jgi:trk system potassium uptake protein TrkA
VVHGDLRTTRIVRRQFVELKLPDDVRIGAIVRCNRVIMSHADTCIESEDYMIFS